MKGWLRPLFVLISVVALGVILGKSCASRQTPTVTDPAGTAVPLAIPSWAGPIGFAPPPGAVLIDVVTEPEPGLGRSLTWRLADPFDTAEKQLEATFASLHWSVKERSRDGDSATANTGSKRLSWFFDGAPVYAVRIFTDINLKGVRLVVELPAP